MGGRRYTICEQRCVVAELVQFSSFLHVRAPLTRAAQIMATGCTILNWARPLKSFCSLYFKNLMIILWVCITVERLYLETMSTLFCYFSQKHTGWPRCVSVIYSCRCLQNDLNISFCFFRLKPEVIFFPSYIFPFLPQNTLPIIFSGAEIF